MALENWLANTKRVLAKDKNTGTEYEFESVYPDGEPDGTPFSAAEMNKIINAINNLEIVYGSNNNGSYVKFPDGTMICWIRKTVTVPAFVPEVSTESSVWFDLPQPYIDGNYAATATASEKKARFLSCECYDTSLKLWLLDENAQGVFGSSCAVSIMTIGRYK